MVESIAAERLEPAVGEAVDALFAQVSAPAKPGAAVLVVGGDDVVFERYYGLADLEHDVPVTADTVFSTA